MSINNQHQAVHWIDGMKLSSTHFLQADAYHTDQMRDKAQALLTDFNYGLLPPLEGMRTSLDLDLSTHTDHIEVQLSSCNAITRGGVRICLYRQSHNHSPIKATVNASDFENHEESRLAVLLIANPFKRIPVGEPDPEESPLRHPYTTPSLRMEIVPESMVNLNYTNGFQLMVGSITWKDKHFSWEENYVPPSATSTSHQTLSAAHAEIDRLQNNLESHSIKIMQTIHQKEGQNRPDYDAKLARNTARLCEEVLRYLADSSFSFKNQSLSGPPVLLVQQAARLAGRLHASLYMIPEDDREKLLAYYYQWTEIKPIQFQQTLSQITGLRYEHLNIMASLEPATRFLRLMEGLWARLSRLKFIGQNEKSLVLGIENEYRSYNTTTHTLLD